MLARGREHPLRQLGRQVGGDGQRTVRDAVRLRVDGPDRMAVILRRRVEDIAERLLQTRDRFLFIGRNGLHIQGIGDGGVVMVRLRVNNPDNCRAIGAFPA